MNFNAFVTSPGLYQEGLEVIKWDGFARSTQRFETEEDAAEAIRQFNILAGNPPGQITKQVAGAVDAADGDSFFHLWFSNRIMGWHLCQRTKDLEQLKGRPEVAGYECTACCGWGCCECSHNGYI